MLPRKLRLPKQAVLRSQQVLHSPLFTLRYRKNSMSFSRFGFVVSKKVAKKAVVRNRLKRVFRHCIEERKQAIISGYDLLFILRQNPQEKDTTSICTIIDQTLPQTLLKK